MSNNVTYYSPISPASYNYFSSHSDETTLSIDMYGVNNNYNISDLTARNFFNELDHKFIDSSLLIPGLRYLAPGIVVFERPPTKKLIQLVDHNVEELCEMEEEGEEAEVYDNYIPIPWQVYIASYSMSSNSKYTLTSVRMYFSSTPLNHPDVQLYMPYVHNFFTNGLLCSPRFETYDEISRYPQNIQGVISSAYDWIWNTGFNQDLYECVLETISQTKNKNKIVSEMIKNNYGGISLGSDSTHKFYNALSKYEPHDVLAETWANPSTNIYFTYDRSYYISLAEEYIDNNNISHYTHCDEDDHDEEDCYRDRFYQYTPYYLYTDNPSLKSKTYKDVMESIYDKKVIKNHGLQPYTSSPEIRTIEAFASILNNSSAILNS